MVKNFKTLFGFESHCGVVAKVAMLALTAAYAPSAVAQDSIPIADAHVHYSHDSVELTPPERVIELMRSANLKFALVSSSDDNGTQILNELAPELIVPGLRPYRRRGETGTWFQDPKALEYVEDLLSKNRYASIGEFHLFGKSADLPIPRRIVELAEEHNLLLQAHSDIEAIEKLLAQSDSVKIIWAHSGFEGPEVISKMLDKHDRLWADLAFRSEVGNGGLSDAWRQLFLDHPNRMMVGTDTYTPERMYYIPEHAEGVRTWLDTLPKDVAENVAWRNAFNLVMPKWEANRNSAAASSTSATVDACQLSDKKNTVLLESKNYKALVTTSKPIKVSDSISADVVLCGDLAALESVSLDASMPIHGHGTNYTPEISVVDVSDAVGRYRVKGLVLHMPGQWQWDMSIKSSDGTEALNYEFMLQ